ncbi:MAG: glycosyltransferase family 2 protein [Candidatus Gottesmanbacteria bacterium]
MNSLSVIIPLKDEAESLTVLYDELNNTLRPLNYPYEIIFINDGSTDHSYSILEKLAKEDNNIKLINFSSNRGKSAALAAGFDKATGSILITLDADLQDDPRDIPKLIEKIEQGYDLVTGWRKNRADSQLKKISSLLFNWGTRYLANVKLHDFNCGIKAMKYEVTNDLYIYGELHRFIPVLAAKKNFKITEIPVNNRPRRFGKSNYGLERSWKGIIDLMTTIFISDYSTKPAHFFGKIGLFFFVIGFLMDSYVTLIKIITGTTQAKIPLLLAGILFIILGVQLLCTGLIAETIIYYLNKNERALKKIKKT